MFILGVIPARNGSKGIKFKNIKKLNDIPLIEYSINASIGSTLSDVMVSTNIFSVYDLYRKKISVYKRAESLCDDIAPMLPVLLDAIVQYEYVNDIHVDAVMILQPTSPLRTTEHIDNAISTYIQHGCSSLYSGFYMGIKTKDKTYDKHANKPHFQRNGAIFITSRELLERGKLWDNDVYEFEMSKLDSVDIDDMEDLKLAEMLLKNREV